MGKPVKRILAVLFVALSCAAAWVFLKSGEPNYGGKTLSRWLDEAFWTAGPDAETGRAIRSMGTEAIPTLLRMAKTKDSSLRRAIVAFSRRQSGLLFRMHSAEDYHRMAIWGFNALGPAAQSAVPDLVVLLNDDNVDVRSCAAGCLSFIGPGAAEAVPALTLCLSNAVISGPGLISPRQRLGSREIAVLKQRVAMALGSIGPAAQQAIPLLTALTNEPIWYARNAAQGALMKIRGEPVVPLIEQLRDTSDPIKWYEVAMLVSDFGTNAEPAIPLLINALGTTNDLIIGHAAIALGRIRCQPEVCVPALIPLLSSPSVSTRQKSLGALSAFGQAATSSVPAVVLCLTDSDPWVRMQATNILRELNPQAAAQTGVR